MNWIFTQAAILLKMQKISLCVYYLTNKQLKRLNNNAVGNDAKLIPQIPLSCLSFNWNKEVFPYCVQNLSLCKENDLWWEKMIWTTNLYCWHLYFKSI